MKKLFTILAIFIIAIPILFFILGYLSKSGKAVGLVNGQLAQCPASPNCVCSEYPNDPGHVSEPIIIPQNASNDTLIILKETIQKLGGIVENETDTYLAATFSSKIFRFVDDVEIRVDATQNVIHVRSASRAGYGDVGANRERVEAIRELFTQKIRSD